MQVEQLSKRYDEKYKATHEQVSRLAFEEKALQDLQVGGACATAQAVLHRTPMNCQQLDAPLLNQ